MKQIEAIRLGADGYWELPEDVEKAAARGAALVQRHIERSRRTKQPIKILSYKDIFIYIPYRKAFFKDVEIDLTHKEYDLLHLFIKNSLFHPKTGCFFCPNFRFYKRKGNPKEILTTFFY